MKINLKNIRNLNTEEKNYKNQETTESSDKTSIRVSSESSSAIFENKKTCEWLTTKEAAEYLRVSPKSLLNQTSNEKFDILNMGVAIGFS